MRVLSQPSQTSVRAGSLPRVRRGTVSSFSPQTWFRSVNRTNKRILTVSNAGPMPGTPPFSPSQTGQIAKTLDGSSEATTGGRKIVFAVDGTKDAEEGLRWLARQVARKGDTIHLAHVLCDPRTPSTAVGSSEVATQWSPNRDEAVFAREFLSRMEREAQSMMETRFIPSLECSGVQYQVDLLRLRVHKSAAGIGEALANRAADLQADMLVIASHGAGVLADYGSVARWCSEHSVVPTLLLPPSVLKPGEERVLPSTNTVLAASIGNIETLKDSFDFALKNFSRPGDNIYAILVKQVPDEETGIALRKQLVTSAQRWLEESGIEYAQTLNVAVDVVTEETSLATVDEDSGPLGSIGGAPSPGGEKLCEYAKDLGARAVVLRHHGHSIMAEMMYGPLTLWATKFCCRPLVVLGGTKPGSPV